MTVPPQNLEAEENVLGAIMNAGAQGQDVSEKALANVQERGLRPDDFYRESHRLVYVAALEVAGRGEPTDVLLIVNELKVSGRLDDVGGDVRLHELAALVPAIANAGHFAGLVVSEADRRETLAFALELKGAAENGSVDNAALWERADELRTRRRTAGLRTRGVIVERVRPLRWLWARRIPCGLPSLLVGEEGVGKGVCASWLVARATTGELDGDLNSEPQRVLIIGDEDAFEPIWVPRLYAAGADLEQVRTLDDSEYLDELRPRASDLALTVERERIGLIVLDALLDHIPGGDEGKAIYNPKAVRQAMRPLRRVAGETGVAALGLMHPIKGRVTSFRQLIAGSHQFNAVSRSSLLLGVDPEDESRRILVRGKGNHSAAPRSFEFQIAAEVVDLNENQFEVPKVVKAEEGERTVDDLLDTPGAPVRDALAPLLTAALGSEPQGTGELAEAVGRDPKDGSVRNTLAWLVGEGVAEKVGRGQWKRG
jgi:DnaB-like helicase N terminal domain/AAA domain